MVHDYVPQGTPTPEPVGGSADDRSFLPGMGARLLVGLGLLVPAVVAWWISYVSPSIQTIRHSFYETKPFGPADEGEFVGLDNVLAAEDAIPALGRSAAFVWFPLATIVIGALLLAFAAHKSGRIGRWAARAALALPMACFAPVALSAGWLLDHGLQSESRTDPERAMGFVGAAAWLTTFGLVVGLGVTFYLSAMRQRDPGRSVGGAIAATVALAALATIAVFLQLAAYPLILTAGGPHGSTSTLTYLILESGFQRMHFGLAGVYSTVLLAILMVLGLLTAVIVLVTRLRVELDPSSRSADDGASGWGRWVALILGGVGLIIVLVVSWFGLAPWLTRLGGDGPVPEESLLGDTWLPPLVSAVVGVLIAAVAGFAIGAVRPLGRWSELLLLPFAPWLFVGITPLLVTHFSRLAEDDKIDTFSGLIPPSWVVVPALFVFTVLFRGLEGRRRRDPAGPGSVVTGLLAPALPMVLIGIVCVWVVNAQSLMWPYLVDQDGTTAPTWTLRMVTSLSFDAGRASLGMMYPAVALVLVIAGLAVAQVFYLDRLAIRVGDQDAGSPPPEPSGAMPSSVQPPSGLPPTHQV